MKIIITRHNLWSGEAYRYEVEKIDFCIENGVIMLYNENEKLPLAEGILKWGEKESVNIIEDLSNKGKYFFNIHFDKIGCFKEIESSIEYALYPDSYWGDVLKAEKINQVFIKEWIELNPCYWAKLNKDGDVILTKEGSQKCKEAIKELWIKNSPYANKYNYMP